MGNIYSEEQVTHILLDNLHQGGKYIVQIEIYQAELLGEEKFTYQNYLSITSIQTDYLNLDRSSCSGRKNERANFV